MNEPSFADFSRILSNLAHQALSPVQALLPTQAAVLGPSFLVDRVYRRAAATLSEGLRAWPVAVHPLLTTDIARVNGRMPATWQNDYVANVGGAYAFPEARPTVSCDSLDGIDAFMKGAPYALSMGWIDQGALRAACAYVPDGESFYYADGGATKRIEPKGTSPQETTVSLPSTPARLARFAWTSVLPPQADAFTAAFLKRCVTGTDAAFRDAQGFSSTTVAVSALLEGKVDCVVQLGPCAPTRILPLAYLVQKAGGVAQTLTGQAVDRVAPVGVVMARNGDEACIARRVYANALKHGL